MSRCIIKTYEVSVSGYPPAPYSAKSAGRGLLSSKTISLYRLFYSVDTVT
jgi:hypothetical protein